MLRETVGALFSYQLCQLCQNGSWIEDWGTAGDALWPISMHSVIAQLPSLVLASYWNETTSLNA